MQIGYLIICRYNSRRLPGKILRKIEGKEILLYIYERISEVANHDQIVVVTSTEKEDDKIADFCMKHSIQCFRGSLNNVALRFLECAQKYNFQYATRINGDNIFVDQDTLLAMTEIAERNQYDLVSNLKNRTFPKGMSIEMVKTEYYQEIYPKFNQTSHNEHVTLFMYENEKEEDKFFNYFNTKIPEAAGIQLAIDTESDFLLANEIIKTFTKAHTKYGLKEIIEIRKNLIH